MEKEKMEKARMENEKMELVKARMVKEKTRAKNHVISSRKQTKDVTKDNIVKGITEC